MADAERPVWRDSAGRVEAQIATDGLLLRFSRDPEGRVVVVMALEGNFDPSSSTKPAGGRVAWCHAFIYDAAGRVTKEIDCHGEVKAFDPETTREVDLERGTALAAHAHQDGKFQDESSPRGFARDHVERLKVDTGPLPYGALTGPRSERVR
jgi:hypothetical protein